MAFAGKTVNDLGGYWESKTLPSSATTGYSSEISFLKPRCDGTVQTVIFAFLPSAITGTNLDIALYGANTTGGTKFLLKDAVVADLTVDATKVAGSIDINAYPAPYYYIAWTSDVDESANTIQVDVYGDLE